MFEYICTICGEEFKKERPDYGNYYGCPYCGQDVERAYPCEACGKLVPDSKYIYTRCERHQRETLEKFQTFISRLTDGELTFLEDKTDGVYWKNLQNAEGSGHSGCAAVFR